MEEGKRGGSRGGVEKQSWRWEAKCVGQGNLGKGRREKEGVNGGVRKIWRVVGRKNEYFLMRRRPMSEEDLDEYRRMKTGVKRMVLEAKKRVNEEWTLSIAENFKEYKKIFWKRENEGIIYEKFDGRGVNSRE